MTPDQKCARDRYKQRLIEAIYAAGTTPRIGGIEYAEEIMQQININRAARVDRSFKLCDEFAQHISRMARMTPKDKRLIEVAFPLKQVSLDSREERAAWAYFHTAYMAGEATTGRVPGRADCDAASRSRQSRKTEGDSGAHGREGD